MEAKSIRYYGYDKGTYLECVDMINSINRKHILLVSSWFSSINVLYVIFSWLNLFGVTQELSVFYISYTLLSVGFSLFLFFMSQFSERHSIMMVYVSIVIMVSYSIIISSFQPYMPASIFFIVITVAALSYIDIADRMSLILLLLSAIFVGTSFLFKTFSIAYYDAYTALIVLTLVIVLHYSFQRMRIQQFVSYHKNIEMQKDLIVKSNFDALTSLLSRGCFFSLAEKVMKQTFNDSVTLCIIDLDYFKEINDNLGHQMGDKAIQIAGATISDVLKIDDSEKWSFPERALKEGESFAGRLGGDEFVLLIRGKKSREEVMALLEDLRSSLNSVHFDGLDGLKASFGAVELNARDLDIDGAYKRADDALYESKRNGKNQVHFA